MILLPIQDYFALISEGYFWGIVGLAVIYAAWVTYLTTENKVGKPGLFLILTAIAVLLFYFFIFVFFFVIQHIFFDPYSYLQLAASFFLAYLALLIVMFVWKSALEREPFEAVSLIPGSIVLILAGMIFPVVPIFLRFVWSMMS